MISFEYVRTVFLSHNGECGLLGVGPDLDFWTEEVYGEGGWLAQHHFSFEGELLAEADESYGEVEGVAPLELPGGVVRPRTGMNSARLNFGGARHRGLVSEDRIGDTVRPLEMEEKMLLVDKGIVPAVPPPAIMGLAQSYVTSEVQLVGASIDSEPLYLLSRRLRIAYRMLEPGVDARGQSYDYDSREVSMLQLFFPREEEKPLGETMVSESELGLLLNWPTDIVLRDGYFFVADSAREVDGLIGSVHVWQVFYHGQ